MDLTYGQKAVGITFNSSNDPKVQKLKELYASIIDICNEARTDASALQGDDAKEMVRVLSVAITTAQTAQMWAVKGVTIRIVRPSGVTEQASMASSTTHQELVDFLRNKPGVAFLTYPYTLTDSDMAGNRNLAAHGFKPGDVMQTEADLISGITVHTP